MPGKCEARSVPPGLSLATGCGPRSSARKCSSRRKRVLVETKKDRTGKYGRYIAEVETLDGENVNDMLVSHGHAAYHNY
jgi:endonuclease YncB( thermonuclease family)